MKTVAQHFADVLALSTIKSTMNIALSNASRRVLATDISARYAVPPFTNSAMDGFAVRAADVQIGASIPVVGDIPAGSTKAEVLDPGTALRIMTGAPMPEGADSVLKVEDTVGEMANMGQVPPAFISPSATVSTGMHVRLCGEDIAVGETVFSAGTTLTPAHLSALAALGYSSVHVYRKIKVGIITTGSELVDPGEPLSHGTIPDSNAILVSSLCQEIGAEVCVESMHTDNLDVFLQKVTQMSLQCDLLITTGGVSAGAFDVVKASLAKHNVTFTRVAMQPGKPQGWGKINETPILCFPGNPVSVFVSMQIFALPLLRVMQGQPSFSYSELFRDAIAGMPWKHKPGRIQFMPAITDYRGVVPASSGGSGSHLIGSLPRAELLAVIDADQGEVCAGQKIKIMAITANGGR